jgi:integrase
MMEEFWGWRMNYWTSGPGVERINEGRTTFYKAVPSGSTLKSERTSFYQVLRWAHNQGFISMMPDSQPPIRAKTGKEVARPAFTYDEYKQIRTYILEKELEGFNKQPTSYGRRMFYNFVRLMFASGMRPNELFSLRWKHLTTFKRGDSLFARVAIPPETKTGKRTTIPIPGDFIKAIEQVRMFSKFQDKNDLIIHTWKGTKVRGYPVQFENMLSGLNIVEDMYGDKRTPYSMRHSYITFRILYGDTSKDDIARNCGTSIGEIDDHYDHVLNEQKAESLTYVDKNAIKQESEYGKNLHDILRDL